MTGYAGERQDSIHPLKGLHTIWVFSAKARLANDKIYNFEDWASCWPSCLSSICTLVYDLWKPVSFRFLFYPSFSYFSHDLSFKIYLSFLFKKRLFQSFPVRKQQGCHKKMWPFILFFHSGWRLCILFYATSSVNWPHRDCCSFIYYEFLVVASPDNISKSSSRESDPHYGDSVDKRWQHEGSLAFHEFVHGFFEQPLLHGTTDEAAHPRWGAGRLAARGQSRVMTNRQGHWII